MNRARRKKKNPDGRVRKTRRELGILGKPPCRTDLVRIRHWMRLLDETLLIIYLISSQEFQTTRMGQSNTTVQTAYSSPFVFFSASLGSGSRSRKQARPRPTLRAHTRRQLV